MLFLCVCVILHRVIESYYPVNIYLFKINNRNTRKRCEICSKLTIKPKRRQTLNIFHTFSSVSIDDFEKANVSWVIGFRKLFLREKRFHLSKRSRVVGPGVVTRAKPLGGSLIGSIFHISEVNQMSIRNSWGGKVNCLPVVTLQRWGSLNGIRERDHIVNVSQTDPFPRIHCYYTEGYCQKWGQAVLEI